MNRQLLGGVLKYGIGFGLLVLVVWLNWGAPDADGRYGQPGRTGLGDVWQRHVVDGQPLRFDYLAAAFVLFGASLLVTLFRWYLLVRAVDLPFTVGQALRLGMIGFFWNTYLPGSVGGDIYKAAAIARQQSRRTVAVASVLMDRFLALWALVWLVALLGGVFWLTGQIEGDAGPRCKAIVTLSAAIVAVSVVVWFVMGLLSKERAERFAGRLERLPKVGGPAAEMWRAVYTYRCRQGTVLVVLLLSWVGHVGFCLCFYCSAMTLTDGVGVPTLPQHFLLVPIGLVVQAMVPLPGGLGAGEYGFGALYQLMGGLRANGVLGSLVQRVITWVLGVPGAFLYANARAAQPVAVLREAGTPAEAAGGGGTGILAAPNPSVQAGALGVR